MFQYIKDGLGHIALTNYKPDDIVLKTRYIVNVFKQYKKNFYL